MRLRLRTVLVLVIVLGVLLASGIATASTILMARSELFAQRQLALLDETSDRAAEVASRIEGEPDPEVVAEALWTQASGRQAVHVQGQGWLGDELDPAEVPRSWLEDTPGEAGRVHYLRIRGEDGPVLLVGVSHEVTDEAGSRRLLTFVSARSMAAEQRTVTALAARAATAGGATLLVLTLLALLVARSISRPLRRLGVMATAVGEGRRPPPLHTAFEDVQEVADALSTASARVHRTVGELQRREARSKDFVSDAAHELRTPLAAIEAVAESLEDTELDDPAERVLVAEVVIASTRRLTRLTQGLLEVSRIDAGIRGAPPETVRLDAWIEDVVQAVDVDGGDVVVRSEAVELRVDVPRASRALANLLRNAQVHGVGPIEVTARRSGAEGVEIRVRDHGPGIAPAHRERVFERFVKLDSSREAERGTGLGLAISRDSARLLGGDLRVGDPPPGERGAVLVLTLPRTPPGSEPGPPGTAESEDRAGADPRGGGDEAPRTP